MNVLYVYKDYFPVLGGIENHIRMLAEGLVRRGVKVQVLVTSRGPKTTIEGINGVQVIKAGRLLQISGAPISLDLLLWLRRLEPDIAHLHSPYPIGELAQLFLGRSRKLVITYHSDVVRQKYLLQLYKPFLRRLLAWADVISVSNPTYVQTSPYLRPVADRCVVIHHGQDLGRLQKTPEVAAQVAAIRGRISSNREQPLLLFVGRLRYYKGLEFLFEAMKRVEARLLVVGTGPMEATWRALVSRDGLEPKVVFLGNVPDAELAAYYHACDVFALPSTHRSETWGAVQIEAMACGKPVVCTELGTGTSYVNLHEKTGLVVPPRDAAALTAAINRLLADETLRLRLGQQGRERAEREFSKESMVEQTLRLYERLLTPADPRSL